jgi:mycothiol synthase
MAIETRAVEVDATRAGPDFWKRYHAYRRARHRELRPDDPMRPDDQEEILMKRHNPFEFVYRYEIEREGVMLSWFGARANRPDAPGYETNKHLFSAECSVGADHRRHGIGGSWLPVVIELMDRHGCTVLTVGTEEKSGHAFLTWLGAEARLRETESRLRLADVDWKMVRRWITEGREGSPDTRLEIHDGRVPEAIWETYTQQLTTLIRTIPLEQLDHGEILITPAQLREWYAQMDIEHVRHHVMLSREPDGLISGVTELAWLEHGPELIYQMFTGVRPDARGRGIGKWLKAAMLEHAHGLYPDARWISTENASSNAPMLAINKRLGFKLYRSRTEYQISRDSVAARTKELASSL